MSTAPVAVILARGLGTRLRAPGAALSGAAAAIAASGVKALMPDAAGRPLLDHLLTDLADAGLDEVLLVIGPEHHALRAHCAELGNRRLRIACAEQAHARGTADAVAAAGPVLAGRDFLVLNSDNRYPLAALRALCAADGPALVGFRRSGLLRGGLPAERVARFAVISAVDQRLTGIVEKPEPEQLAAMGTDPQLSMNCWRFDQRILAACARIAPRPREGQRGELELPDAVALSMAEGCAYAVIDSRDAVLDLSSRDDVANVQHALAQHVVDL